MAQIEAVLDLLRRTDRQFTRTQRRYPRIRLAMYLFVGSIYCFALSVLIPMLVKTWQGGDWLAFWAAAMPMAAIGASSVRVIVWTDPRAELYAPLAALRDAARTGDSTLAPTEVAPRDALESSLPLNDTTRIGPLRRPVGTAPLVLVGLGVLKLAILAVAGPYALATGSLLAAAILFATLFPAGALLALLGGRAWSPLYVRTDTQGARWRLPSGRLARIAWQDARAFFQIRYSPRWGAARATQYVLDAGQAVLSWRVIDVRADAQADAPNTAISWQFCRIITERTGLPLRDLSVEALRIASLSGPGSKPHPSRAEVWRRLRVLGVVLLPFLVLASVAVALMLYGPWYYAGLYAQAHAHRPLYTDALAAYDGDWPVTAGATFKGGAYQLTNGPTLNTVYMPAPRTYNDALFEVSARTNSGYELGGVGLAIQGPQLLAPLLNFWIAPDGTWWLERLPPPRPASDGVVRLSDDSAIHRGFGVSNHIAVLVRGGEFTFYVNGQYATGYQDDALVGGQVGLYLDPIADSGSFSDFAVYPL
jgi:hypothetical protein